MRKPGFLLPPVPPLLLTLEVLFVVGVSLFAARDFLDLSGATQLAGSEMEFLTSSAHYAALHLHRHGHIPLWQPYLGEGRPLLESPFAFVLNPFSTVPSLLFGDAVRGIKLSVVIYALLTAFGGWFCGRAFGMGTTGRLLLVLLLLGKGNMTAMLGIGHFQLGVAQAYMPWIIGAAFLVLRGHRQRWAAVLLATAFALQFLAGNIWHVLPTLMSVALLTVVHIGWEGVNWRGLRGMVFAAVLTVGISAAVLVPLWANRAFVGGQATTADGDRPAPVVLMLRQYVTAAPLVEELEFALAAGELETRYNYTVPGWFLLVTFVLLPPIPLLYQPELRGMGRVWLVAGVLLVFFTAWGIGGLQPFRWAYNNLPGVGRWRFVGRAFGMASFWLALLVALRVDGLHRALGGVRVALRPLLTYGLRYSIAGVLLALSVLAGMQVVTYNWREWVQTVPAEQPSAACLQYLQTYDANAQPLSVNQRSYRHVQAFVEMGVRQFPVAAAYSPVGLPNTYYDNDFRGRVLPRYAMPTRDVELPIMRELGYAPVAGSPLFEWVFTGETWRCLWEKPNEPPYAFSARVDVVNDAGALLLPLPPADVDALVVLQRTSDIVTVLAEGYGGARGVAVLQEAAYPGWRVYVDGERAQLESVGGFVGVLLPLSTDTQVITFAYRPPLLYASAWVTIGAVVFCTLYLLRAERLSPFSRSKLG